MSEESVVIASVLIIILLIIVAFLGFHGGKGDSRAAPPPPQKEPVFGSAPQMSQTSPTLKTPPPTTDKTDNSVAVNTDDAAADEVEVPQQELPLMFEAPTLPLPSESLLTADICYVVHFYGEQPLQAAAFAPLNEALQKQNISVYRVLGYSESAGEWRNSLTESFPHWLVAVPLADRGGQLKEDKINVINEEARRFAQKLRLHPAFPPLAATLRRAQTLDDFCHAVDMVLEFRMRCPGVSQEQVRQVMATQKLVAQNGRYVCRVESESLFSVRAIFHVDDAVLFFTLDAPKVSSPEHAFDRMTDCIRRAAAVLGGEVTDPNGKVISSDRHDDIKRQLTVLRKQMTEYGVAPGGAMAHLLFS